MLRLRTQFGIRGFVVVAIPSTIAADIQPLLLNGSSFISQDLSIEIG
jgi:hypothetical protein